MKTKYYTMNKDDYDNNVNTAPSWRNTYNEVGPVLRTIRHRRFLSLVNSAGIFVHDEASELVLKMLAGPSLKKKRPRFRIAKYTGDDWNLPSRVVQFSCGTFKTHQYDNDDLAVEARYSIVIPAEFNIRDRGGWYKDIAVYECKSTWGEYMNAYPDAKYKDAYMYNHSFELLEKFPLNNSHWGSED